MKKIIALLLVVALTASVSIAGTMAYLQDEDSDINVMTMGNVKIEQIEQQEAADGSLEPFQQGKGIYPGTGISKIVSVENTGKSDAYFRTLIAFEDIDSKTFGVNFPIGESSDYTWSWGAPAATIVVNGVTYQVYEALYKEALKPGETSPASLTKVEFAPTATNEDMKKLGDTYEILVLSQAVQTQGFADAKTALDTAFGKTSEKAAEWFAGMGNAKYVKAGENDKGQLTGDAAAEFLTALNEGNNLFYDKNVDILAFDTNAVDAKGATVTMNGTGPGAYGYLSFLPAAGEDVTVSNLNATGSGFVEVGHYGQGGGTYTVTNLTIKDLASTLANENKGFILACAFSHYGDATLNNCSMTGATALTDGAMAVDAGFVNGTTTVVNGGEYGTIYCWSHAVVTIDGAKVDTLYAAPINGTVTVKAGTQVDTIVVDYGNIPNYATKSRLEKLVIEAGASVGAVKYDGQYYTVPEWTEFVANFT